MQKIVEFPLACLSAELCVGDNYIILGNGYLVYIYTLKMELKHKLHLNLSPIGIIKDNVVGINKQQEIVCIAIGDELEFTTLKNPHKYKITRLFLKGKLLTLDTHNVLYMHYKTGIKSVKVHETILDVLMTNYGLSIATNEGMYFKSNYFSFNRQINIATIQYYQQGFIVVLDERDVYCLSQELKLLNSFSFIMPVIYAHSISSQLFLFVTEISFHYFHTSNRFLNSTEHNLFFLPHSVTIHQRNFITFTPSIVYKGNYLFIHTARALTLLTLPSFNEELNKLICTFQYEESLIYMMNLYKNKISLQLDYVILSKKSFFL